MNREKRFLLFIFIPIFLFTLQTNVVFAEISIKEEKKLGEEFISHAFKHYKIIKDYTLTKYINSLGNKILKVFPDQPFKYNFYILNSEDYNAFAAPAAHIFLHRGLITAMDKENELAGILAHEISHVALRHISSMIEKSKIVNLGVFAGFLAGILLSSSSNDLGEATIFGSVAAGQTTNLSYSRDYEIQADQFGLKHLMLAGYTIDGILDILGKIKKKEIYSEDEFPTYLKTHPMLDDRISYLKTTKTLLKYKKLQTDDFVFKVMKARLIALYEKKDLALKHFEAKLKEDKENPIFNYGYALILSRLIKKDKAIFYIDKAIKLNKSPYFLKAKIEIFLMYNENKNALNLLKKLKTEKNIDYNFFTAKTHFQNKDYNKAIKALEIFIKKEPNFNEALNLISKCYGRTNKLYKAYSYLGLYYKKERKKKRSQFYYKKAEKIKSK